MELLTFEQLRSHVADMLDLESPVEIGDDTNLMDLGLDSIRLMALATRWQQAGLKVHFADLAERPHLGHWRSMIVNGAPIPKMTSAPQISCWPLTEAQEGMWYAQRIDATNSTFNTAQYVDIRGHLDVDAFRYAVTLALDEADGLAVRIFEDAQGPTQILDADGRARADLEVVDLSGRDEYEARAWMLRDMQTPLDLEKDRVARQGLLILSAERHWWYQRVHHVAIVAFGTALLTTRIRHLYRSRVDQQHDHHLAADHGFGSMADVIAEDAAYRTSDQRAYDRNFWLNMHQDQPEPLGLPGSPSTAAASSSSSPSSSISSSSSSSNWPNHYYHHQIAKLTNSATRDLQMIAARSQVAWPDVLVALIAVYVARHTSCPVEEVVLGVVTMNRLGTAAARVPTIAMNILPVRLPVDEDLSVEALAAGMAERLKAARQHGRYRSEQLRRDLGWGPKRKLYGAFVDVLPFEEQEGVLQLGAGITADLHVLQTGPVDDCLDITLRTSTGGTLLIEVDADPALYSLEDVSGHAARLTAFLTAAAENGNRPVAAISTLTPAEHRRWVVGAGGVNDTAHSLPEARATLVTLIEASMLSRENAMAIQSSCIGVGHGDEREAQQLTYAELDYETARLAAILRRTMTEVEATGSADDVNIVAVALQPSVNLVVAIVAILRSGAAYLPLDLEQNPEARIREILESAGPGILITTRAMQSRLPAAITVQVILIDNLGDINLAYTSSLSQQPQQFTLTPHSPAYVIHKSGSVGEPKGVVIEHRSIVNRLVWMHHHYGIVSDDRILHKTPATFDVSVWELLLPLVAGATLVLAPAGAHKDPQRLVDIIHEARITTLHFVPSMMAAFLADKPSAGSLKTLRRVFVSGEVLPTTVRDAFLQRVIGCQLNNLYGQTETTIDVMHWDASEAHDRPVAIGHPVWNTRVYVLDRHLRPVPPGTPGQLCVAGVQVARGYIDRSGLTRERFLADPFVATERMYLTGDRARWRTGDGALEFLGRLQEGNDEGQVTLCRMRVELGEVEAVMASFLGLRHAIVVMRSNKDSSRDQNTVNQNSLDDTNMLVAYVVLDREMQDSSEMENIGTELKAHTGARVPAYMVPSAVVVLPELPLTSHGKLDRAALPEPQCAPLSKRRSPHTPTERSVAQLIADTLGLEAGAVSADSDFFLLGGHSLLAARLATAIRDTLGAPSLSIGTIFAHSVVAMLSAHIDSTRSKP